MANSSAPEQNSKPGLFGTLADGAIKTVVPLIASHFGTGGELAAGALVGIASYRKDGDLGKAMTQGALTFAAGKAFESGHPGLGALAIGTQVFLDTHPDFFKKIEGGVKKLGGNVRGSINKMVGDRNQGYATSSATQSVGSPTL